MNYFDDDEEFAETVGEAMERSRERESRGRIEGIREETSTPIADHEDPFLAVDPTFRPAGATPPSRGSSTTAAPEMSAEDEEYLAWQEDTDPLGPGGMPPDRATVLAREAEMAERDGDTRGAETMRSYAAPAAPVDPGEETVEEDAFEREARMAEREGDVEGAALMRSYPGRISPTSFKGGSSKGSTDDALEGYDMSAVDALAEEEFDPGSAEEIVADDGAAPDRDYLLEAFGGNEVDDTPEGWADAGGALYATGGRASDNEAQGIHVADRRARDRGTELGGRGARVEGTLDMSRPGVQMPDGSEATVRSASFGTDDGEVLLPTISPDGAEWSDDEAFEAYRAGGGHLGIYDSPEAATAAAEGIHESEAGGWQGADAADEGAEYASGYATDEDPELPGSIDMDSEGELGQQGPGGWASDEDPVLPAAGYPLDDNEAVEATMGIDDDELAEEPGAALGAPWSPEEPEADLLAAEGGGRALADPRGPSAKVPTVPGEDPLALDAGLPTEGEIGNERGWDVFRQITGRIGNALRVAGGGAHRDIEEVAPGLEEERRAGIRSRTAAKGASAAEDRRSAMESAPTELELAQEERRRTDSERRAGIDTRRLDIDERRVEGTEAERAREASEREARVVPTSDLSRAAQARLRMELDAMSTSPRLRVVADAFREGLDGMSAADVERIESSSLLRPFLNRDGGSGGGGGGALGAGGMDRGERAEVLVQAAVRRGMPEAEARATLASLGAESFSRTILGDAMITNRADAAAARRADAAAASNEVVAGVPIRAGMDVGAPEARAIRQRVERYRDGWVALNEIDRIAREHGVGAVVTPEIRAEVEPYMLTLISLGAAVQNSGTLNAGERPIIEATLPDPSSIEGTTLGGFTGSLRGWRNRLRQATSSAVSVVAPGARNRTAAEYWLTTGEVYGEPGGGETSDGAAATVRVRDRESGVEFDVPADTWAATPEEERAVVEVVR